MKKYFFHIAMSLLFTAGLASCYSDDSTLGDPSKVGSIEIEEFDALSVVSYAGNSVNITPKITTTYNESDLEYAWYLYEDGSEAENGFRTNCISKERNLNYEVNLPSGAYTIALEITSKSTGLKQLAKTSLATSTPFSSGFYILKETTDGNAELDLLSPQGMTNDLIAKMTGKTFTGKPVNLSVVYGQNFTDPTTYEKMAANCINVINENGLRTFRSEDMAQVFDEKAITYAGEENNQKFTNISNTFFSAFLLSDQGVAYKATGDDRGASIGKFALPSVEGNYASYLQILNNGMKGVALWDVDDHAIYNVDYNCIARTELYKDATATQECIASGINKTGSSLIAWFLCENKADGKRFLHLLNAKTAKYTSTVELDPSLHISKATQVAACGGGAAYIYAVDGGKLYAYGFNTGSEVEIPTPGISGNITFVTNQWLSNYMGDNSYNFNNLIVGTQSGNEYKLYFYDNLVGGAPSAEAVKTASGTGKVKAVRYVCPITLDSFDIYYAGFGSMTIFPTSE